MAEDHQGAAAAGSFCHKTLADGNCLVRALCIAAFGNDSLHQELRVRISCELAIHSQHYTSPEIVAAGSSLDGRAILEFIKETGDYFAVPTVKLSFECETMNLVQSGKNCGPWHLLGAASVLQCRVLSGYPSFADPAVKEQLTRAFLPKDEKHFPLKLFWTSNRDLPQNPLWMANHVVPVVRETTSGNKVQPGDFVVAKYKTPKGSTVQFRGCVVVPPPHLARAMTETDVVVKFLRAAASNKYHFFPDVEEMSIVSLNQVSVTQQPRIDNRGHYYFK